MRIPSLFSAGLLVLAILTFTHCDSLQNDDFRVLVFSKTAGFRHASIPAGQEMLFAMGKEHGFQVDTTEDGSVFTQRKLKDYNVVVFLSTTGDILDAAQQQEMQRFIQAGGGFVGIHAAADTEYEWPWYNGLVGAYFNGHPSDPNVREADILVDDRSHVSTEHLPEVWHRNDEWYNYRDLNPDIQVLMRLDETSYEGGTNGDDHPIAWYHEYDGGRAWYTGGGHTDESFAEPNFVEHVWGGIQYAAGDRQPVDYNRADVMPEENRFQRTVLAANLYEPMEMDLLPDGRPIFIQRGGDVIVYDPEFAATAQVGTFDVHTEFEDGLMGMALDPDFTENNWIYFYYSPQGEESIQRLSRFKFTKNKVQMDTEQIILTVPVDRNECCHSGGSVEFGPDGLLFLSIGDNTNPFRSAGYSPNDERPGRKNWDAARSSSNTQDLRGKILRIRVNEDGSYSIPEGNLFANAEDGRPEIYVMGCRNPFRISIDQHNGNLYWGDVGPDARTDSAGLGPRGHDEVNLASSAGYYGWPFFIADNKPYYEKDFATGETAAEPFDPEHPINNSPNNTGLRELPPARPAMIYYPYAASKEFPQMGSGGRNAMAGPVYYEADFRDSENRLPAYYDGKFIFYDWVRDFLRVGTLDEKGWVVSMEPFLPSFEFSHPMDMVLGPDGDLYVLEYGQVWYERNPDARLVHIDYLRGNRNPVPVIALDHQVGAVPLTLTASAEESIDYDGDEISYRWLINGEAVGTTDPVLEYTFETPGEYELTLELTDAAGNTATHREQIFAGNEPPELVIDITGNRTFYFPDEPFRYAIRVTDREDGSLDAGIDPQRVAVSMDYLAGEDPIEINFGHEAMLEQSRFIIGKSLIAASDCAGCHQEEVASTGPAYVQVARKYRDDPQAEGYLAERIVQGGSGVWGERAMAAHPDLGEAQARQMARYILSLAGESSTPSLPLRDEVQLAARPGGGKYLMMASYTDAGNAGMPPLTSRKVITLRSPQLAAANFQTSEKVRTFDIPEGMVPGLPADTKVLIARGTGWTGYGEIDLNGIGALAMTVLVNPERNVGGTIEVVTGDPVTGTVVGSYELTMSEETAGMNVIEIPISTPENPELSEVYLRFRADGDDPEGSVGVIVDLRFIRARPAS